jgi:hypothetical protein
MLTGARGEPTPRALALIAIGAIAATLILLALIFGNFYRIENPDHSGHFPWLASALIWIAVGVFTWQRWPASRLGPVMVLCGFAHYGYALGLTATVPGWLVGWFLGNTVILVVAFAFLSFPSGRLRDSFDRRLYVAVVGWWAISGVLGILSTPHDLNPLLVITDESAQSLIGTVTSAITGILTLIVAIRVVQRWRNADAASRPAYAPVVLALVPYLAVEAAGWLERAIGTNAVSDAALSLPVLFVQSVAFPVAVLYVLWRVAPRTFEAATPSTAPA